MANESLNIWNRALAMIGAPRISSVTELSSSKTLIDDHWDGERKEFLASHPWDGSSTVKTLAKDSVSVIPDRWTTAFTLPAGFLQGWRLNDLAQGYGEAPLWEILTLPDEVPIVSVLLTDQAAARLEYSFDLSTDAGLALLGPVATKALVSQLAVIFARPWGKKESDIALLVRESESALSRAMFANGKQAKRKAQKARPLVDARNRRI